MNQRTAKLSQKKATKSGESIKQLKREWQKTPKSKRGELRKAIISGLWAGKVREWQTRIKKIQKEAAQLLDVPFETYRDWCDGDSEPSKMGMLEVERRMREIEEEEMKKTKS